ncbi:hypothetical protein CEXT_508841 [Caerostris extrusa]|uniref:Ribosomal protein S10 n=1 Tax=Caerostris extrusa TaxID=172846 RepID=A0AAV4MAC8_CAEEX|nr:hypothetical protein CEXT_508841 [Caerostris extrusa]
MPVSKKTLRNVFKISNLATEPNSKRILMHIERIEHFSSAEKTKKMEPHFRNIDMEKARPQKEPLVLPLWEWTRCIPFRSRLSSHAGHPSLLLVLNLRSELWE